jgi:hypothetical protein
MAGLRITEEQIAEIICEVIDNARQREEDYLARAAFLTSAQKEAVRAFFPQRLLDGVRVLELKKERVPNPAFQERAQKRGYRLMLDFQHMADITHPRLIILQQKPTSRLLFHALVHVVQYDILGLERYLELYVRAFVSNESYTSVPLEVQAFQLDQRFTENPDRVFSVEDEVRSWAEAGKYSG